jgi:hypothetical protein
MTMGSNYKSGFRNIDFEKNLFQKIDFETSLRAKVKFWEEKRSIGGEEKFSPAALL